MVGMVVTFANKPLILEVYIPHFLFLMELVINEVGGAQIMLKLETLTW